MIVRAKPWAVRPLHLESPRKAVRSPLGDSRLRLMYAPGLLDHPTSSSLIIDAEELLSRDYIRSLYNTQKLRTGEPLAAE